MELTYRHQYGKIKRLLAIHMPVSGIEISAAWYQKHLGLEILNETASMAEMAVVGEGGIVYPKLVLVKSKDTRRLYYEQNGRKRSMVMMHASNLGGLYERMLRSGVQVTSPHSGREGDGCGSFIEVVDPSGNIIQVQRNEGETPAGHTQVEAIFNLEIPVTDVRRSARFYAGVLGFQLIREPDEELAIVKTGPYYEERFGYREVQEFGCFLFRHGESGKLHFTDRSGNVQECLTLLADGIEALYEDMKLAGREILSTDLRQEGLMGFVVADPDGNRINLTAKEQEAAGKRDHFGIFAANIGGSSH